jgi:4-hydroxy-tetrahydrodipicolinate synthase
MLKSYSGYIPAVVSPFKNGKLDIDSFEKYIFRLVNSGISGMVVCGSTGESLSLSIDEKLELIKTAAKINNNKIKLICGIIDSITDYCKDLMKQTESIVDGFLCICPFYVKPSQNQIYNHFKTLSQLTKKDIILYNNPSRVGTSIGLETLKKLCELENIVAIKECTSDLSVFTLWRSELKKNFIFLTGNDDTACAALSMGAEGVISVSANVAPELCVKMYSAFKNSNIEQFNNIRDELAPLHNLMFAEPTPGPVKYALSKLGLMKDELRMPLSSISLELKEKIDTLMGKLGLI